MAHCTDSFGKGWNHMIRLLFQPFRFVYWLKMTILFLFMSGISSMNYYRFQGDTTPRFDNLDGMADQMLEMMPYFISIAILVILLMILFTFLSSAARILFYKGILDGVIYYMKYFREQSSSIISYFLWNVIVTLVAGIVLLLISFGILLLGYLLGAFEGDTLGLVISITLGGSFIVILFILVILYFVLLDSLVLPIMVVKQRGIFAAWSKALGLALANFWDFTGYVLIRIAIGIFVGIVTFFIGLFLGMLALLIIIPLSGGVELNFISATLIGIILLPIAFIINFFLLPIPAFKDSYALSFMGGLTGDSSFEPINSTQTDIPSEPAQTQEPQLPNGQGPVDFKDIPSQDTNNLNS